MITRSQSKIIKILKTVKEYVQDKTKNIKSIPAIKFYLAKVIKKPTLKIIPILKDNNSYTFKQDSYYLIETNSDNILVTSKICSRLNGLYNFNNSCRINVVTNDNIEKSISTLKDKNLLIRPISLYDNIIVNVSEVILLD